MKTEELKVVIEGGEDARYEFKQNLDAVDTDLIVALANSELGGVIVVGVIDERHRTHESGTYIDTPLSDRARLAIQNKAIGCIPPIALNIEEHVLEGLKIVVVEVESSNTKPHCTPKGLYRIRSDGRNRELQPNELLSIFLRKEESVFLERFKLATDGIMESVSKLDESTKEQIDAIGASVRDAVLNFKREVDGLATETQDIFAFSEHAADNAEQAVLDINQVDHEIQARLSRIEDKIDNVLAKYE